MYLIVKMLYYICENVEKLVILPINFRKLEGDFVAKSIGFAKNNSLVKLDKKTTDFIDFLVILQ